MDLERPNKRIYDFGNREEYTAELIFSLKDEVSGWISNNLESISSTLKPFIQLSLTDLLHTYRCNSISYLNDEGKKELEKLVFRIKKADKIEKKFESCPFIPPVGIELELPGDLPIVQGLSSLLIFSDIPFEENLEEDEPHYEVSSYPTYSYIGQTVLFQKLADLGLKIVDPDNLGGYFERSVHVNFGINDRWISKELSDSIFLFSVFGILAYTSVDRLRHKKTDRLEKIKEENCSSIKRSSTRVELASFEFKDKSFFRMIKELQFTFTLLLAYYSDINYKNPKEKEIQAKLEEMWQEFYDAAVILKDNIGLDDNNTLDIFGINFIIERLSKCGEEKKLKTIHGMRRLFSDFSQRVQDLLFGSDLEK